MLRKPSAAARARCTEMRGVGQSSERAAQACVHDPVRSAMLQFALRPVMYFLRWLGFEVLPLPLSTRGFDAVGTACRLVGCAVSIAIMLVQLQASATTHGDLRTLLWTA